VPTHIGKPSVSAAQGRSRPRGHRVALPRRGRTFAARDVPVSSPATAGRRTRLAFITANHGRLTDGHRDAFCSTRGTACRVTVSLCAKLTGCQADS